jgi:hypothetical protein
VYEKEDGIFSAEVVGCGSRNLVPPI